MIFLLEQLLEPSGLTPHGFCLLWEPGLIWLHAVSDALIALAYFSIPVALVVFVRRRRDFAYRWVVWLFAAFILACGTTHLLSIVTLWSPLYWLEGTVKLGTAAVSVLTAVLLWPLLPRVLALPSPAALRMANDALSAEIAARDAQAAELRRSEEQLRQLQKMEAVGRLTGGIAHDFNNMLTVVLGSLELLRRRLDPAEERLLVLADNAAEAARKAASLTRQLLAFSRQQALEPSISDINGLIAGLSDLLRRTLGESYEVELSLAPSLPPIHADPNQVESALLNLIVNARDAMPAGGQLTIATTACAVRLAAQGPGAPDLPPGPYVVVSVADTGHGMTQEVIANALEPFFTTKPPGQGTGLGLSQVFGFLKQSGGDVRIASAPGQGTTIRMLFPAAAPPY